MEGATIATLRHLSDMSNLALVSPLEPITQVWYCAPVQKRMQPTDITALCRTKTSQGRQARLCMLMILSLLWFHPFSSQCDLFGIQHLRKHGRIASLGLLRQQHTFNELSNLDDEILIDFEML